MRRNEAELQAALDEARFHSRRPAARPARSEPAEPPAYEAMWGAPQFSDDSSDFVEQRLRGRRALRLLD